MCGNRVEELEARVQELEASVEGLTDELVESKVRIRELENAIDEDLGFGPSDSPDESADVETTDPSVGAETIDADPSDSAESAADTTKTEGTNTDNKTEESESDIIIA